MAIAVESDVEAMRRASPLQQACGKTLDINDGAFMQLLRMRNADGLTGDALQDTVEAIRVVDAGLVPGSGSSGVN